MKTTQQKLADHLEVDGWDTAQVATGDLEWWADEIWELTSTWSPVGAKAFLTLLVDPIWEGQRSKGQGVWAFGLSQGFPDSQKAASSLGQLPLRSSSFEVEEFVELIASTCRSSSSQ